jgi:hypothetical protein
MAESFPLASSSAWARRAGTDDTDPSAGRLPVSRRDGRWPGVMTTDPNLLSRD